MNVAKELTLNVTGTMTINGSVDLAKDAALTVDGSLGVTGNFVSAKDAIVTVNGDMDVDGDLNLGTGSVILGTGPVTTGDCTGSACGDSQLPVELLSFSAKINNHFVDINWTTATEEDNDYFTIERSKDGIVFEEVVRVQGAGNSIQLLDYTYTDKSPYKGVSYYRLKQSDFDGKSETFKVNVVQYTTIDKLNIYPNRVKRGSDLRIVTGAMSEEIIQIEIFDHAGHVIKKSTISGDYTNIEISTDINSGIYFLRMTSGEITKFSRIVIQ